MASIADFINHLAKKAGIPEGDEALKNLLSAPVLSEQSIDDNLAGKINSSLMNETTARNSETLKKHFTALALNGIDSTLENIIGEYQLDDDEKRTYDSKNTWGRVEFVSNLIKAKEAAKAAAVGGEKKTLVEEINKLQQILKAEKEAAQKKEQEIHQQYTAKISDLHYDSMLSGFEWATDFPAEVNKLTLKQLVDARLKEKGAKMVFTEQGFALKNANSPDLDYMDNGNVIPAKDFITKVAADSKLLKVTDPNPKPATKPGTPAPATPPAPGSNSYDNSVFGQMRAALKGDMQPA